MKKIYFLFVLILLFSNVYISHAQLVYTTKNYSVQRPNNVDINLLHTAPQSDYNILEEFPDQSDNTFFKLTMKSNIFSNEIICTNDSIIKALDAGDNIDASSTIWTDSKTKWLCLGNYAALSYGEFLNVNNKFIGLRMIIGGNYFYGYIQMSVVPSATAQPTTTIHDMAYQKTAGKGLIAGQTAGLNHIILNTPKYILNDHQLNILADRAEKISITDISGHQLLNADVRSNKSVDLSAYPNGIYLITISTNNGILTDKILLR